MATKKPDNFFPFIAVPTIVQGALRGRLVLQPGSVTTDNEHGLDTLVRPFFGFTDEIHKLAPKRGDKDKWLPTMRCTDRSFTEGRGLTSTVQATYRGLIQEALPNVVVKGGWAEQTAQIGLTTEDLGPIAMYIGNGTGNLSFGDSLPEDVDESSEVQIVYRAPTTTFMYVTRKRPNGPKFQRLLLTSVMDFSILEMRPAIFFGKPIAVFDIRTSRFDVEQVGAYWQCTEENRTVLMSRGAAQLRYLITSGALMYTSQMSGTSGT